ncbi:thyroid hormone receptor alpha-like [Macrobrachium nipponense]|uniref:thyroid hormone receptor alpha-like n=1 Tax=Macrobrachium nipponense TaxID=159736 RepID=UPI0030C7C395
MAFYEESREDHQFGLGVKEERDFMELDDDIKDITKEELEDYDTGGTGISSSGDQSNTGHKVCSVCRSSAKSSHFGALCCDPCRAFFRRSVQNNLWETFICFKDGRCDITKNRRSCQRCRFKKCLSSGMDKSLVMTEEERKALMNRKIERRKQIALEHQRFGGAPQQTSFDTHEELNDASSHNPDHEDYGRSTDVQQSRTNPVDEYAVSKIIDLQKLLRKCLTFPEFPNHHYERDPDIIENLFIVFCKNIGRFFGSVPEFRELDPAYQGLLLKPAVAKAMFIFGTHQYDPTSNCWPRVPLSPSCKFPSISMSDMESFIDDDITMRKWKAFIEKFLLFFSDEVVTLLTLVVSLFDYKDSNFMFVSEIALRQAKYLQLFKFYLQRKHCQTSNTMAYLSYLKTSLTYVEELKECFQSSTTEENEGADQDDSTCPFSESLSNSEGNGIAATRDPLILDDAEGFSFLPAVSTDTKEMIFYNSESPQVMPLPVKDEKDYISIGYPPL